MSAGNSTHRPGQRELSCAALDGQRPWLDDSNHTHDRQQQRTISFSTEPLSSSSGNRTSFPIERYVQSSQSFQKGASDLAFCGSANEFNLSVLGRKVSVRRPRRRRRLTESSHSICNLSVHSHRSAYSTGTRSVVPFTATTGDAAAGISSFLAACLTVNFISVGYLFVPYAFATTGLVLTSVVFLLVMLQSFITCTYVMESCARAELLASKQEEEDAALQPKISSRESAYLEDSHDWEGGRDKSIVDEESFHDKLALNEEQEYDDTEESQNGPTQPTEQMEDTERSESSEESLCLEPAPPSDEHNWWYERIYTSRDSTNQQAIAENLSTNDGMMSTDPTQSEQQRNTSLPVIRNRKFELPELSRIFLGETWRIFFTVTICCDLYGLTWSVASVFASSLASNFSMRDNQDDYVLFIVIFAAAVVPMSFLSIVDQLYVQLLFFVGRLGMVALMLGTTAVAFNSSEPHFGDQIGAQQSSPLADFRTLHLATQICIFSTAFQFSVPVIAEASEHKPSMRRIYGGSTGFIAVTVLILSLLLASFFGSELMEESSNLNWAVYHGGTGTFDEEVGDWVNVAWWAKLVSKYVVLYPAIDGISTFVLCSVSLGEILMGSWYGSTIHDLEPSWKRRVVLRLLGSVPQLVGAAFVQDLSVIATYAGLFTVASYTICPCLLQIYSSRMVKKEGLTTNTRHSTIFSNERFAWVVAFLGTAMIFYAIIGSLTI